MLHVRSYHDLLLSLQIKANYFSASRVSGLREIRRRSDKPDHVTRIFHSFMQSSSLRSTSHRLTTTTIGGFSQTGVGAKLQSGNSPEEIDGEERGRALWVWHSYLTCPLGTRGGAHRCSVHSLFMWPWSKTDPSYRLRLRSNDYSALQSVFTQHAVF